MLKLESFPTTTPLPQAFNQPTILVGGDSLVDRRLVGQFLEKEGKWRVVDAGDGVTLSQLQLVSHLSRYAAHFELHNDPRLISPLVARLRNNMVAIGVCDENGVVRVGIAIEEALLNALYHGNLEVSSDLKLEDDCEFYRMAAERRVQPPYCQRRVHVTARFSSEIAEFIVADQGPGFDIRKLPDPNDPEVLLRPSGRGLMLMKMFMDEVTYNAAGDTVTMVKRRPAL